MDQTLLKQRLEGLVPDAVSQANNQYVEMVVPNDHLLVFCKHLKTAPDLMFDYLISLTAVDWKDHFMMVYHITSSHHHHTLVVKTRIDNREVPVVDSLSGVWRTAEFHECEVYDLFGISFSNHPNLRRIFLDDDYGFPLRKDFTDETRMIIR